MASKSDITRSLKLISWLIPGASFTAAVISSILNSEFVFRRSVWGCLLLAGLWLVMYFIFKTRKLRPDKNSRIVFPGKQVNLFFVGAIAALWVPLLFTPLKTQKVEIVLDVSPRMWKEFDPPGTTKFDAARGGVLDALEYLKNQNVDVSLRLIKTMGDGQCAVNPETSLVVDFTKDFDEIRNYLDTIQPVLNDQAPVVSAIDSSIDHYLEERLFDQKFFIYMFVGGDDTCGEKLGLYLTTPKVKEYAIESEIFLIILLGTDEEASLKNLDNVKLDYARNAAEVEEIVEANNALIVAPTLTPTPSPSLTPAIPLNSGGIFPANPNAAPGQDEQNENPPSITGEVVQSPPTITRTATATYTATFTATSTFTRTFTPAPTATPTKTQTPLPTSTPVPPTAVYSMQPEITGLSIDPATQCNSQSECKTNITIRWVPDTQANGKYLTVWVRPIPELPDGSGQDYFSQNPPQYQGDGNWKVTDCYIGRIGDPDGLNFAIYAIVTDAPYEAHKRFPYLPSHTEESRIDVIRGTAP